MKKYLSLLFLLWAGTIIVLYYVVQKPGLLGAYAGLLDTIWTLIVAAILLFNAYGMGGRILRLLRLDSQNSVEHLLLAWGVGLGVLGLLGLLFSILQLARGSLLTTFQIALAFAFVLKGDFKLLRSDLQSLGARVRLSVGKYSSFTRLVLASFLAVSCLLVLVPPFEAFDALLYHLALPATILQSGGLRALNIAPFWFPSLSENVYLWALGMGSERAAQVMHLAWMLLAVSLLWHWTSKVWNGETARKVLMLVAAVPSLPLLSSWAYADMSLVYYAVAALYGLTQHRLTKSSPWLHFTGMMVGLAMGTKFTSVAVPLSCGLLVLFQRPLRGAIFSAFRFSLIAVAIAAPWYIRNGIFMGNPFYPFLFGGLYWDSFLSEWYAGAGTGIGWNALQIVLLPLNLTLGTHDITFYDGRIGPLFLLLLPATLWIVWRRAVQSSAGSASLLTIGVFSLVSFAAWTLGVISSSGLWQARLLFPALIPFAIPSALAWDSLRAVDTSRFRLSFLVNALVGMVLLLTVFDQVVFVAQRNPLAVAIGAQSRQHYIERVNPSYAGLIALLSDLPADARLYSLFEPRFYGLPRQIQADPLLYNFAHDVYLFHSPDEIIKHWKLERYTHVIVYERGLALMNETPPRQWTPAMQAILQETLQQLPPVAQTPDKVYSLYRIP